MTATTDSTDENLAAQLHNQLADWISGRGTFQTLGVEQAFCSVSRHEFLPGHPLEDAYSRKPVFTQRAPRRQPGKLRVLAEPRRPDARRADRERRGLPRVGHSALGAAGMLAWKWLNPYML